MSRRVWVNGTTFEDGNAAAVAVTDRGLAYGDGLFETLRVASGRPVLFEAHLARLAASAAHLGIAFDAKATAVAFAGFVAGSGDAVAKIILTRGCSGRGYLPDPDAVPTLIFSLHLPAFAPAELATQGIVTAVCQQPLGISPLLAGHKHLNRLEQVLLRRELATHVHAHEAIVSDVDGYVIEGVFSNVFWVLKGVLHTPQLSRAGVCGVMRQELCDEAQRTGIPLEEGNYRLADVMAADEVFFCNSLYGIWPVRRLAGHERVPGPITRRLQHHWDEMLDAS